jgi:hypothetical protein
MLGDLPEREEDEFYAMKVIRKKILKEKDYFGYLKLEK